MIEDTSFINKKGGSVFVPITRKKWIQEYYVEGITTLPKLFICEGSGPPSSYDLWKCLAK